MKYLSYFIIAAIVAFFLGKGLAVSWLVVISFGLGVVAISLVILSGFKMQQSAQAHIKELSQKLAEQEKINQTLEQSLAQSSQKLAEQEQNSQTLEQSLAESKEKLAEQEQNNQTLEQSLAESKEKLAEQEQRHKTLEQYRRDLDDAQVGLKHALTILGSYQMAIQLIPGNHRGDCFVEKTSLDRIKEMSSRSFDGWLRVIQNQDNQHSKDIRERLEIKGASTIDLPTLENTLRDWIETGADG